MNWIILSHFDLVHFGRIFSRYSISVEGIFLLNFNLTQEPCAFVGFIFSDIFFLCNFTLNLIGVKWKNFPTKTKRWKRGVHYWKMNGFAFHWNARTNEQMKQARQNENDRKYVHWDGNLLNFWTKRNSIDSSLKNERHEKKRNCLISESGNILELICALKITANNKPLREQKLSKLSSWISKKKEVQSLLNLIWNAHFNLAKKLQFHTIGILRCVWNSIWIKFVDWQRQCLESKCFPAQWRRWKYSKEFEHMKRLSNRSGG